MTRTYTGLDGSDLQRIIDVLLSTINGELYPINDITKPHLEKIIEQIDIQKLIFNLTQDGLD